MWWLQPIWNAYYNSYIMLGRFFFSRTFPRKQKYLCGLSMGLELVCKYGAGNLRHEIVRISEGPDPFHKQQQKAGTIISLLPTAIAASSSVDCFGVSSLKVDKCLSCLY